VRRHRRKTGLAAVDHPLKGQPGTRYITLLQEHTPEIETCVWCGGEVARVDDSPVDGRRARIVVLSQQFSEEENRGHINDLPAT